MTLIRSQTYSMVLSAALIVSACSKGQASVTELMHFPADSLDGLLVQSGVEVDTTITSDGKGSLRFSTDQPVTVRLYETGDLDVEKARLLYRAKIRTQAVEGKVYLEMWCHFPGKGEFFSRALHSPLSGSVDWSTQETLFFLKKGENPDNVRLNLVIDGKGTAWIDDIRLIKGPL